MAPMFPPDSPVRTVLGEGALLLGGGRALLMQVAHPSVAAGVAEHSDFARNPFARLARTLEASYGMVFGTEDEARDIAQSVTAVHERVRGPGYHATDPELIFWVHATLIDTALQIHTRFLRPLGHDEAEAFYRDSMILAELFGCPRQLQPPTLADVSAYTREMVATIKVSDTGRALARDILHARLPWPAPLALAVVRELTVGLLPRPLREEFGLGWDRGRKRVLLATQAASRVASALVPAAVRRVPVTLLASAA